VKGRSGLHSVSDVEGTNEDTGSQFGRHISQARMVKITDTLHMDVTYVHEHLYLQTQYNGSHYSQLEIGHFSCTAR